MYDKATRDWHKDDDLEQGVGCATVLFILAAVIVAVLLIVALYKL